MKAIERGEIMGLAEYEMVREHFRARVIAEKKRRRVEVGNHASVVFENRDTVLLQIQEMLRTERITRPAAIQHEIDTYNELLPGPGELSCTLMLEIADKDEREAFLVAAKGLERHVWLVAGNQRIAARSVDRGGTDARTTAVHYLRFVLSEALATQLQLVAQGGTSVPPVELAIDHPAYSVREPLPAATVLELGQDLIA